MTIIDDEYPFLISDKHHQRDEIFSLCKFTIGKIPKSANRIFDFNIPWNVLYKKKNQRDH